MAQVPAGNDEQALVDAFLLARDETAFRTLFRRHTPALLMLAVRLLGSAGGDAEDAVQEVWMRAARSLEGFAGRSTLRTWLMGILVRCCHETLRKRRRAEPPADEDTLHVVPQAPRAHAERLDLERAIAALPDGYRAVFVLHDVEGWTHQEIAAQLDIEEGTSKSQLARARQSLRSYWAGRSEP